MQQVAREIDVPQRVVSRLAGSVTVHVVDNVQVDVGLSLKFVRKQLQVDGYARRRGENIWELSDAAIRLLRDFKARCPELFQAVALHPDADAYEAATMFGAADAQKRVEDLLVWMRSLPSAGLPLVPCDGSSFAPAAVRAAEELAQRLAGLKTQPLVVSRVPIAEVMGPVTLPLRPERDPTTPSRSGSGGPHVKPGTRVAYLLNHGPVAFGSRGTVVSVRGFVADVVWDEALLSGHTLGGRCQTPRGLTAPLEALLNLSHPEFAVQKVSAQAAAAQAAASAKSASKRGLRSPVATSNPFDLLGSE
jgi:hypothetical protein